MYASIAAFNSGVIFIALLAFGLLNWFQIPTGSILDWAIGIGIFEWSILIVTVPWNIYFKAQAAVQTGKESQLNGISVEDRQIKYASGIATKSLIVAIFLHLSTAIGLYWLAINGITALGYWSSIGVLLLTLLRPAISTYEYLAARLTAMQEQFAYPRADILELRSRFQQLEDQVHQLTSQLDTDDDNSWLNQQNYRWENNREELSRVTVLMADMKASNELEHQRLAQEAKQAISQITVDGQFLEHARELIRFFKTA
jgi:cell division protein FtsB